MIPGYNHNVKYKEKIFHVQTEDSGKKQPHIITLLYYGGNILKSFKLSYADKVNDPAIDSALPNIMQKQHKEVLRGLITGKFDELIEQRSANASFLNGPAPLNVAEGSQHNSSFGGAASPAPKKPAEAPQAPQPVVPAQATPEALAPEKKDPKKQADGAFSTEGSLLEAMNLALPPIDAEALQKALDSGDDSYVFGGSEDKKLDDMMLDFLKGS